MRGKRLAWSLFFAYAWIVFACVAIILAAASYYSSRRGLEVASGHLEEQRDLIRIVLRDLLIEKELPQLESVCQAWERRTGVRITVATSEGQPLCDSRVSRAALASDPVSGRMTRLHADLLGTGGSELLRPNQNWLEAGGEVRDGEEILGYVRVALPMSAVSARGPDMGLGRIFAVGLLGVAATAAISFGLARRFAESLQRLSSGVEHFAAGDLERRIGPDSVEEFSREADTINAALERLETRLRSILQQQNEQEAMLRSMADGVLAIDRNGHIINLNATCARLLGASAEGSKGRLVHEMIRKPDLLRFVEVALDNHQTREGDIELHGPEDRCLHAQSSSLYDSRGQRIGALIMLHDVTRIRRLENVRRDFVANVSHELRTPITSIKGFIETLLDGASTDVETAERFLRITLRQVNRLDAIIADLLTLSRIEKGVDGRSVRLQRDSIGHVLEAAVEMCAHKSGEKGVRVALQCEDGLEAEINATLLEQAVINLVDNAIKYSPAEGEVLVEASQEEDRVIIQIRDQGCGIEARHLPRLFERFYRVDKARSRELGGTGLGLAIVKHIALTHRGSVGVESTLGKGSTFSIVLPAAVADVAIADQS